MTVLYTDLTAVGHVPMAPDHGARERDGRFAARPREITSLDPRPVPVASHCECIVTPCTDRAVHTARTREVHRTDPVV